MELNLSRKLGKRNPSEDWLEELCRRLPPAIPDYPHQGGPDDDFLRQIATARSKPSLLDPRMAHVGRCPYCLRRIMQLREEKQSPRQKITRFKPVLAAAAVLLVVVFTLHRVLPLKKESQQPAVVARVLDLRGQAAIRGPKSVYPPTLILPRAQDQVTLVLPELSEEGTYRIQLLSDRNPGTVLASTQGVTVRQGDQLRLPVQLDLHQVPAGPYHLSTTYGADEASYYYAVHVGP